jgi:hypothetical protein
MKLDKIYSNRNYETWPSWDLVFEWENIYKEKFNIPFAYFNFFLLKAGDRILFLNKIFIRKNILVHEMGARSKNHFFNNKKVIPYIIDYHIGDNETSNFEKAYCKNPIVLVSSFEIYQYLIAKKCKLKIDHLALSISDKYKISPQTNFKKEYDLVLMGRQNPVLEKYLAEYIEKNPSFRYVFRKQIDSRFLYFTSDGEVLGDINTREKYIDLMRKSKVGLYSTSGIDLDEKKTKGFNQVTPRFLELVACGCHILARYKKNPDTDYYNLENFSRNIDSYEKFEEDLNTKLNSKVDMEDYAQYLESHYTSKRANKLEWILNNL